MTAGGEEVMDENALATVYEAQNSAEAEMLCGLLKSNGVDCVLLDRNASGMVAGFGPAIHIRLAVKLGDLEKAREILKAFEQK